MMRELADNILDIAQNSVAAGASLLKLTVDIDRAAGLITLVFDDNGRGMPPELLSRVTDPFTSTRTTRKVGLGLPLLEQTAEMTGGSMDIESTPGVGTRVRASFGLDSIDRPPMGDVAGTLLTLIICNEHMDFLVEYRVDAQSFVLDTAQVKQAASPLPLSSPDIAAWLLDFIKENIQSLHGGANFQ